MLMWPIEFLKLVYIFYLIFRTSCYKCNIDKPENAKECMIEPRAPKGESSSSDTPRPRPGWVCSCG